MIRTLANFVASLVLFSFVFLLAALALPARAQDTAADILMAEQAAPLRRLADQFVSRAIAGDAAALQAMFSPALVERTGSANVQRVLQQQIVPFFAKARGQGRSVTTTRTTDVSGSQGFAFYMWLLPAGGGEPRPFTVYTVVENGHPVVANIVPDRLVPGRHQ
ncbi:MAG TPA: hypothetical protein VK439_07650 [Rubrivivax sp.]|nr:hypothetical protein [Rubrivivax sp.]